IALHRADEREADAGVPAGRLDDRALAGVNVAGGLGRLDHRQRDAVLHRAAGIALLALAPELGVLGADEPRQPDERRSAGEVGELLDFFDSSREHRTQAQMKYMCGFFSPRGTPSSRPRRTRSPTETWSNQPETWFASSRHSDAVTICAPPPTRCFFLPSSSSG